jgi:hypothetical protein
MLSLAIGIPAAFSEARISLRSFLRKMSVKYPHLIDYSLTPICLFQVQMVVLEKGSQFCQSLKQLTGAPATVGARSSTLGATPTKKVPPEGCDV